MAATLLAISLFYRRSAALGTERASRSPMDIELSWNGDATVTSCASGRGGNVLVASDLRCTRMPAFVPVGLSKTSFTYSRGMPNQSVAPGAPQRRSVIKHAKYPVAT